MAHSAQAKKRIRQNEKARLHNHAIKSDMRSSVKKALAAIESNDEKAEELVRIAHRKIDMAVQKGILHTNTGARKKSRLARANVRTTAS